MGELELSYLAALIDGEGTICLLKKKSNRTINNFEYECRVSIANTNEKIIDKAMSIVSTYGPCYIQITKDKRFLKSLPLFHLYFGPKTIRVLFPKILSYLIKSDQAKLLLEICEMRKIGNRQTPEKIKRLEEVYLELKRLHNKI